MARDSMVPTMVPRLAPSERSALAGITGVLFLTAVGALVVVPAHGSAASTAAPARPTERVAAERITPNPAASTVAQDGRVLARITDAGFLGVVADPSDPSRLDVVLPTGPRIVDCNVLHPVVTVSEQNAEDVRLVVSGYQWVTQPAAAAGGTTCVSAGSTAVPVTLTAPLGQRHVYDGSSPSATVVADPADLPTLDAPPAGYTQRSVLPASAAADRLTGVRTYGAGADQLVVRVGDSSDVVAPAQQVGSGLVDQQYVVVSSDSAEQCATWTEISGRVRQVCSVSADPLSAADLLRLAQGLTPAG